MKLNGNEKNPWLNLVLLFHAYMHGMYVDCLNFELLSIGFMDVYVCMYVMICMASWVKDGKWMKYE